MRQTELKLDHLQYLTYRAFLRLVYIDTERRSPSLSFQMSIKNRKIEWSEIDKPRFYGIGTGMYTAITIALHPITVLKTRQQIITVPKHYTASLTTNRLEILRGYYRGLGVILLLAIPARGVYIGTLENSREVISKFLCSTSSLINNDEKKKNSNASPFIASISGGLAGGAASMVSQTIVVPMDVISQRQMVMDNSKYAQKGKTFAIMSNIIKNEGFRGLFRGFQLSLLTSLPVGSMWWGTYSCCQHLLSHSDIFRIEQQNKDKKEFAIIQGAVEQIICGISAAIITATVTQPLDVIKTMIQVGNASGDKTSRKKHHQTYSNVVNELYKSSGFRGFFRGVGPRIASMGLWGTVLSSAYEYLRHISRKGYEFRFAFKEPNNIFQ